MQRATLSFILFLSPVALIAAGEYFPPPDNDGGWRTLQDAAQIRKIAGMDLKKLNRAFEYAQRSSRHGGDTGWEIRLH